MARVRQMLDFATAPGCLTARLVGHFGESIPGPPAATADSASAKPPRPCPRPRPGPSRSPTRRWSKALKAEGHRALAGASSGRPLPLRPLVPRHHPGQDHQRPPIRVARGCLVRAGLEAGGSGREAGRLNRQGAGVSGRKRRPGASRPSGRFRPPEVDPGSACNHRRMSSRIVGGRSTSRRRCRADPDGKLRAFLPGSVDGRYGPGRGGAFPLRVGKAHLRGRGRSPASEG